MHLGRVLRAFRAEDVERSLDKDVESSGISHEASSTINDQLPDTERDPPVTTTTTTTTSTFDLGSIEDDSWRPMRLAEAAEARETHSSWECHTGTVGAAGITGAVGAVSTPAAAACYDALSAGNAAGKEDGDHEMVELLDIRAATGAVSIPGDEGGADGDGGDVPGGVRYKEQNEGIVKEEDVQEEGEEVAVSSSDGGENGILAAAKMGRLTRRATAAVTATIQDNAVGLRSTTEIVPDLLVSDPEPREALTGSDLEHAIASKTGYTSWSNKDGDAEEDGSETAVSREKREDVETAAMKELLRLREAQDLRVQAAAEAALENLSDRQRECFDELKAFAYNAVDGKEGWNEGEEEVCREGPGEGGRRGIVTIKAQKKNLFRPVNEVETRHTDNISHTVFVFAQTHVKCYVFPRLRAIFLRCPVLRSQERGPHSRLAEVTFVS